MAKPSNVVPFSSRNQDEVKQTLESMKEQMDRTYALIAGAKARLKAVDDEDLRDLSSIQLLDMAETEISDYNAAIRLAELAGLPRD